MAAKRIGVSAISLAWLDYLTVSLTNMKSPLSHKDLQGIGHKVTKDAHAQVAAKATRPNASDLTFLSSTVQHGLGAQLCGHGVSIGLDQNATLLRFRFSIGGPLTFDVPVN